VYSTVQYKTGQSRLNKIKNGVIAPFIYVHRHFYEVVGVVYCPSFVISSPAIAALDRVLSAPVSMALMATRETSALRPGAICAKTPIWLPREPMLAKPQRA